jgi:hypothetical protein
MHAAFAELVRTSSSTQNKGLSAGAVTDIPYGAIRARFIYMPQQYEKQPEFIST